MINGLMDVKLPCDNDKCVMLRSPYSGNKQTLYSLGIYNAFFFWLDVLFHRSMWLTLL